MRAAVMRNKTMVVADVADPTPGPGQVLVETIACGICGSRSPHAPSRRQARRISKSERRALRDGSRSRHRYGPRVQRARDRARRGRLEREAGRCRRLDARDAQRRGLRRHRLLEHLPRRVRRAHAAYGRPLRAGAGRPRPAPRGADRADGRRRARRREVRHQAWRRRAGARLRSGGARRHRRAEDRRHRDDRRR